MYNSLMAKKYKKQKKKTTLNVILNTLFKTLIAVAVVIFSYIILVKTGFTSGGFDFTTTKKSKSKSYTPTQLKWYDSFKGVENVPDKNKDSSGGNTGFKYQGFNK